MKRYMLLVASLALSGTEYAYDKDGIFSAWGSGSCGQLIKELKLGQVAETVNEMYVQGFVAGINATIPGKADFFAGTDSASRFRFVVKYCEENPLSSITGALAEMVKKITGEDMQNLAPKPAGFK